MFSCIKLTLSSFKFKYSFFLPFFCMLQPLFTSFYILVLTSVFFLVLSPAGMAGKASRPLGGATGPALRSSLDDTLASSCYSDSSAGAEPLRQVGFKDQLR